MPPLRIYLLLITLALSLSTTSILADWTGFQRINRILILEDGGHILRVLLASPPNPSPLIASGAAACDYASLTTVEFILGNDNTSKQFDRLLHSSVQMALLTSTQVRFLISEESCSTNHNIPIAIGIDLFNN